ncbi:MAG: type II toxin-antitoxin system RelE/ParE family toxin [Arcobacteraceae bacterium]
MAQDNLNEALKFHDELIENMQILRDFPLMYQKSKKFQNTTVRDMIFKKYVIPYKIEENEILILGIFNQNLWQTK